MLLLFRDRLVIEASARHLSVSILKKGWRPKIQPLGSLSFEVDSEGPLWMGLISTLKQWMSANKWKSTDIQLVISDSFTRYVLLPWSDGLKKKSEIATLARIHFDNLFGGTGQYASIVLDIENYGQAGIACAMENEFLNALKNVFGGNKNRLISIEPHFVKTFNVWRNRIGGDGLLVFLEQGHCIMSFIKNNTWQSIRAVKLAGNIQENLLLLIEREIILQGANEKTHVYLDLNSVLDTSAFLKIPQIHLLGRANSSTRSQKSEALAGAV